MLLKLTKQRPTNGGRDGHAREALSGYRKIGDHIPNAISPSQDGQTKKLMGYSGHDTDHGNDIDDFVCNDIDPRDG